MMPMPGSLDELPEIEVRRKGDWKGPIAKLIGLGVWFGAKTSRMLPFAVAFGALAVASVPNGWVVSAVLSTLVALALVVVSVRVPRTVDKFMNRFHTVIGDTLYTTVGADLDNLSESLLMHEKCHRWQQVQNKAHNSRYLLSVKYRRHAEAQAYSLEVVFYGRDLKRAASSMADPIYVMLLEPDEALSLMGEYIPLWEELK
jgi:hypothetical protein